MGGFILDDSEVAISAFSPVCTFCTHFKEDKDNWRSCSAYKSIPLDIWEGKHDHKTQYPGDGGYRFTEREDT